MFKKLSIIATIIIVALSFFTFAHAIEYVDSTTLYRIAGTTSATSTGWAIVTTESDAPNGLFLIGVDILDCNTTANVITIYDACTYADATNSNRILGKLTFATASTYINGQINDVTSGKFGDIGGSFSFVYDTNRFLNLKKGLLIGSTRGANYFTIRCVWRKP
jgi:hypothetical protein